MSDTSDGTLLGGRVKYRQLRTGHRSGFEPVLLAASVAAAPHARILELGTGAGAGLLCLAARLADLACTGVEIDPTLARLAQTNFNNNGFKQAFAVCADIAHLPLARNFDHVLANPPWYNPAGTASPDPAKALARRAAPGLSVWVAAMAALSKPAGQLHLILPAASRAAALAALAHAGHGDVTIYPLRPKSGAPPRQIILRAQRSGGGPHEVPGLVLHDAAGITPAAEAVLRHGEPLVF